MNQKKKDKISGFIMFLILVGAFFSIFLAAYKFGGSL
jgi:heme/copper-type cytochrome/quinol oxidase subunit 3